MSKYYPSVPKLEYLAGMTILQSFLVEFDIFKGKKISFNKDKNLNDYAWFETYYYYPLSIKINELPIPLLIKQQLCTLIWTLTSSLRTWLYKNPLYTKETDIFDDPPVNYYHLKELVFRTDGSINEIETAINVLQSGRLTRAEKFELTSEYCLEDKLPKPSFSFPEKIENGFFWQKMLMCYWYCRKYKKMPLITKYGYAEDLSIPYLLITGGALKNRQSLQYFWVLLNYEEKVRGVTSLIPNNIKPEWYMLNELKEVDLQNFYLMLASHIKYHSVDVRIYVEFLLPMWSRIKDVFPMSKCYKIFVNISDHMTWCMELQNIVTEMWQLSSEEMKEYLLEKNCIFIGRQFLQRRVFHKFIEMLLDSSNSFRKKLIKSPSGQQFCHDLLRFNFLHELELFMNHCLSGEEVEKLKKKLIKEDEFGFRLNR